MQLDELVNAFSTFGWQGLAAVGVILGLVFIARKSGLVATGNQARIANIVLSAILFGLNGTPEADTALQATLASVLSGLVFELLKWATSKIPPFNTKALPLNAKNAQPK